MVKKTAQRDIKPQDSMHTPPPHQPLMSALSAESRRIEQSLQPHFSPSIPRVNSTRYLQDTKGVAMATLRDKLICTPALVPWEDSNCGKLPTAKTNPRPPSYSHSITFTSY